MNKKTRLRRSLDKIMQPSNFMIFLCLLLLGLTILYCALHVSYKNGSINYKPSVEEISMLNSMSDSDNVMFERQAIIYLNEKFDIVKIPGYEKEIRHRIQELGKKNFVIVITGTGIRKKSFFWLNGDASLVEVAFWSLFGALCSFLYYFVENYKKSTLQKKEFPSYIAKLFYTPYVTIIIYLSPNLFTKEDNFSVFFGHWTIVIAFVLGFFSGRAIELLDRLKNFIFPYNTALKETLQTTAPVTEVPEEILLEAIKEKTPEWNERYGPFESIAVGKKRIGDEKTDVFCIQFDVKIKSDSIQEEKVIPHYIEYKAKNNLFYNIPTDVNEVGETKINFCYEQTDQLLTGSNLSKKLLGLSCSRSNMRETGSIGLKVKSVDPSDVKTYLLSCYHVLCPLEIRQDNFAMVNNSNDNQFAVCSPSSQDGGNQVLATVRRGFLQDNLDIAMAELINPDLLENRIYGTMFRPSTIILVGNSHARQDYEIRLTGRTSGRQKGYIESAYTNLSLNYPTDTNPNNIIDFQGLIKTCKISEPGDSGAAVYDTAGNIIGILFASNSLFSYVIPIKTIFNKLKIRFA